MGSEWKSLADRIDAIPLNERDGDRVLTVIRKCVTNLPEMIEEIFPGKKLVKRRLTAQESALKASKASSAAAEERYEKVKPIIKRVLDEDPEASLAHIKHVLDNSGVTPVRSAKWSRATINFIIQKANLRAENQP